MTVTRPDGHDDRGVALAAGVKTLSDAARLFRRFSSPKVLVAGLGAAVIARVVLSRWFGFGVADAVAVLTVVALVPFVEWFIHLMVLHAKPRTVAGFTIDPGIGHREHHRNPATVNWVLLRGIDAGLFQVINAGLVVVVVGGPLLAFGADPIGPIMTGVVAAMAGLLHYEWSHFLFHTAYRPRTRYYRRLKRNHRLHHWRNERYWLGVTTNLGDRVLRTYPASRSAVPLSATARELEI